MEDERVSFLYKSIEALLAEYKTVFDEENMKILYDEKEYDTQLMSRYDSLIMGLTKEEARELDKMLSDDLLKKSKRIFGKGE